MCIDCVPRLRLGVRRTLNSWNNHGVTSLDASGVRGLELLGETGHSLSLECWIELFRRECEDEVSSRAPVKALVSDPIED